MEVWLGQQRGPHAGTTLGSLQFIGRDPQRLSSTSLAAEFSTTAANSLPCFSKFSNWIPFVDGSN
jgi:hypothetical protein